MSDVPPVGSVLRLHYYDDGDGRNALGREKPWAVVTTTVEGHDYFQILRLFDAKGRQWNEREMCINLDAFDVIPPEKWPPKVCVAMAKRALLGETNNGQG